MGLGRSLGGALLDQLGDVLAGVFGSGEEERDRVSALAGRDDAGGEDARASVDVLSESFLALLFRQPEDSSRGIVIVEDIAVGGLSDQLLVHGSKLVRGLLHQVPLRGCRKGAAHRVLRAERRGAGAVLEQRHRARRGLVVFLLPR